MQLENLQNLQEVLSLEEKKALGELLRIESSLRSVLKRVFEAKAFNCHMTASMYAQEVNPVTGQFRNAEATEAAIEGQTYQEVLSVLDKAAGM